MNYLGAFILIGFSLISSYNHAETTETKVMNVIERYLSAYNEQQFAKAGARLHRQKTIAENTGDKQIESAATQLKRIHQRLGNASILQSNEMPSGKYSIYEVGVLPDELLPGFFFTLHFPVRFNKAGKGVITFVLGKAHANVVIDRVQYWCFSCIGERGDSTTTS